MTAAVNLTLEKRLIAETAILRSTAYELLALCAKIRKGDRVATSQNGYPANDESVLGSFEVNGRWFRVRKGACLAMLKYVVEQFNSRVENIDPPGEELDDWSYNERPIRGSATELSNHASGTAVDLNSLRHPLGTAPSDNFSEAQQDEVNRILNETGGTVRWGGNYTGRQDPMHFEINAPESEVAAAVARLPQHEGELTVAQMDDILSRLTTLQKAVDLAIRGDKAPAGQTEETQTRDEGLCHRSEARRLAHNTSPDPGRGGPEKSESQ
jgi:hypothetical protein